MQIVVTGGEGQLGKSLRHVLETNPELADMKATFIDLKDLDLTNFGKVDDFFAHYRCDLVVNCAAYTDVEKAEMDYENALKVNCEALGNLAYASVKHSFRIIHISTDYVFDGKKDSPYEPEDVADPQTAYGKSKLAGEKILMEINPESLIIRTSWLYSPYGKNFFLTMRDRAIKRLSSSVVADQTGSPTSAHNLANAILHVAESGKWIPGIYHFTDAGATSWFAFAKEIYFLAGADERLVSPVSTEEYGSSVVRPKYSVLNKTKIIDNYGVPIVGWEESLKQIFEWN